MAYLFDTTVADRLAIALPSASAGLSIAAGIVEFCCSGPCTALLSIAAGLFAVGGIFASNKASAIRDDQMRFWIEALVNRDQIQGTGFGS